jgi:diguanylate cyclase (GGDEF)-like protein
VSVASLLGGLAMLWLRRGCGDGTVLMTAAIAIGVWTMSNAAYARGPLDHRLSALYLVSVSVAILLWFVIARRTVDQSWPSARLTAGLAVEPLLLALSALLPAHAWGRIFWPPEPWHHEPLGIGYAIHTPYCIAVIAAGAAPLVRRAERMSGPDRWLAIGAVLAVSTGVGAQLAGLRIMPLTAFAAAALVAVLLQRTDSRLVGALAELAERDPVTGAIDRAGLDRVLRRAVGIAREQDSPLSVLVVDVDDFKGVNDAHGHLVGDLALRHIASILRETAGPIVGRFGGDEFVVVLPDTDLAAAQHVVGLVTLAVATPVHAGGTAVTPTVSIGVATYDGGTVDDLLVRADQAMYAAKRSAR